MNDPTPAGGLQADDRFWTIGRTLAILAVAGLTAAWIWIFLFAPRGHPDRLEDRTFPDAAEVVCADARADLSSIPRAFEADDPSGRADFIDEATQRLSSMVEDLEDIAPAVVDEETSFVQRWLADWRTYLGDRDRYAAVLRTNQDPAFSVTEKDGVQVTEYIDGFADANGMESCRIPLDV